MAKKKISDLVKEETESRTNKLTELVTNKLPNYLTLVRKEARLREEQVDELTSLARKLNRKRGQGEGERITENTLIRIAVDLLLERSSDLNGVSEKELRASLGLENNRLTD